MTTPLTDGAAVVSTKSADAASGLIAPARAWRRWCCRPTGHRIHPARGPPELFCRAGRWPAAAVCGVAGRGGQARVAERGAGGRGPASGWSRGPQGPPHGRPGIQWGSVIADDDPARGDVVGSWARGTGVRRPGGFGTAIRYPPRTRRAALPGVPARGSRDVQSALTRGDATKSASRGDDVGAQSVGARPVRGRHDDAQDFGARDVRSAGRYHLRVFRLTVQ